VLALAAAILVAVAIAALSLVVGRVFRQAFDRYREKYAARSARELSDMFLFVDAGAILALDASGMVVGFLVGLLVQGWVVGILLALAGFFAPQLGIHFKKKRRLQLFERQLVDALQAMSNALRAGLTFQQAAEQLGRDAPAPLGQEFSLMTREVRLGVALDDAMVKMAARVGSEDLEIVVTATSIARQLGGNLGEILETLAATIRERFRLEGKIKALTAQGKLQGIVVAAMPVGLGIVLNAMRPDLTGPMLAHPFGWALVAAVAILETIGVLIIRKIVNVDV
jgi:tight adherence protein B